MEPSIEIEGLRKAYVDNPVLEGIDLTVHAGEVFGYIGPNGAGKTTTVKILTGMVGGFEGTVKVAGHDVFTHPEKVKKVIGYVPENAVLYESLTVAEFLRFVGRLRHLDDSLIETRAASLLDAFGLDARAPSRLGSLSKGMRQKILICSALLHNPDILFLDEPLAGLDVNSTILIKELVRSLADQGKTIFYCSHLMDVVERVCDRIAILSDGKIAALGTLDELSQARAGGSLESIFSEVTGSSGEKERVQQMLDALAEPGS